MGESSKPKHERNNHDTVRIKILHIHPQHPHQTYEDCHNKHLIEHLPSPEVELHLFPPQKKGFTIKQSKYTGS